MTTTAPPPTAAAPPASRTAAPWIAVREVMSPPAASLPADAPLGVAVAEVLRTRTDRLWVTAPAGGVIGVLTDAALVRAEVRGVPAATPAGDLAAPVTPLHAAADAAAAVHRLGERGEPRVPVVDAGRLVGELTRADVLGLVHSVRRVAAISAANPDAAPPTAAPAERRGPAAPRFLSRARRAAERVAA